MAAKALGAGLILVGVVANRYVLALLSSDHNISSRVANVLIVAFELACIAIGVWLIRRRPRGSANAALALTAALLAWGIAEGVALTTGMLVPATLRERHRTYYEMYEPDSTLGFRLRPNLSNLEMTLSDDGVKVRYDTDERGFRNVGRDYATARVWVIGDSFAFGVWMERDSTFYGRLERSLGGPIITLGTPGYDLTQYAITLEQQLAAHRPDLVILCIYANDLKEEPSPDELRNVAQRWDRYRSTPWREKLLSMSLARWLLGSRLDPAGERIQASNGVWLYRQFGPRENYFTDSLQVDAEGQLDRIIERTARDSVRLMVFLLPSRESAHADEFRRWRGPTALAVEHEGFRRMCALAARRQVPCYDLTNPFQAEAAREILFFPVDVHWNARGHAFVEREMYPHVAAQLRATRCSGSSPSAAPSRRPACN